MNRSAGSPEQAKKSMQEAKDEMNKEVKAYLNPHDRFANRMKASLSKGEKETTEGMSEEQKELFVD